MRGWVLVVALGACSFDHGVGPSPASPDAGSGSDALPDGSMTPDAPFATGPFGAPELVTISMSGVRDDDITLTGDMLEIFFESDRVAIGQSDIYTSRRASVNDAWSLPVRVDELSTAFLETSMEVSVDGLTLYFSSNRPPSMTVDVFVATRPDRASPWNAPVLVSSLSTANANEYNAQPWGDTVIYLGSDRMPARGGSDIFRATRTDATAAWSQPTDVAGLDTNRYEGEAFVDAIGAVWFTGDMEGDDDLYRAEPDGSGGFETPQLVPGINTAYAENDAWLSPDGHTLYFTSTRGGSLDIYVARR
jgi:hypothetical protein